MKPLAYNLVRDQPVYRREAFSAGLAAAGFDVSHKRPSAGKLGDVLLIWNRYSDNHALAAKFEADGGTVIVSENAYLGSGGISPHDQDARQSYALARGWHNDSTVLPEASPARFDALGIVLQPWRADGGHILVCPNRSFGAPNRMMPSAWAADVAKRLAKITKREIRIRPHPGNKAPKKPLAEDLAGAWATVIWSSSAGVHSLIAGVPVICEAPYWICKGAAGSDIHKIENVLPMEDAGWWAASRALALHRLAHGQFNLAEIESGDAFDHVLRAARQA